MRRRSLILHGLGLSMSALVAARVPLPADRPQAALAPEQDDHLPQDNLLPADVLVQTQDASIQALPDGGWLIASAGVQRLLQFRDGWLFTQ